MSKILNKIFILLLCFIIVGCNDKERQDIDIKEEIKSIDKIEEEKSVSSTINNHLINEDGTYFEIHYIDVGQGDAALIACDDRYLLIDGGPSSASQLMYSYLKNKEIDYLDYIICSHPDEDHVGGLSGALNYAKVGCVYSPGSQDTRAYGSFVKYVVESNSFIIKPNINSSFELGSSVVEILAINIGQDNDSSIVVKITYKNTTFLFTGDSESITEEYLVNNNIDISCDVLKIAHHGSCNSTCKEFLEKSNPKYAIISVGKNNSYGHPSNDVLNRLEEQNIKVLRTDINGDIICFSDGHNLTFNLEKSKNH